MDVWEHKLEWEGARGGFVGRSARARGDDPLPDRLADALTELGRDRTLVEAEQVHGGEVAVVREESLRDARSPFGVPGADGLVTDAREAALAIYVADCLAVFLHDPVHQAVGLAHAGWRGLLEDIPGELVRAMVRGWGGDPAEMQVALSPCIRHCCFEVGEEVAREFDDLPGAVDRSRERPHVDMIAVARAQIERQGVPAGRIEVMSGCTRCEPERFASYRWDPDRCGRNVALIALA